MFKYIPESRVLALLDWDATYDAVKASLSAVSSTPTPQTSNSPALDGATGYVNQPQRTMTHGSAKNSVLYTMPAYLHSGRYTALACKLSTSFPENAQMVPQKSTINANIALFDEQTGELKALVGGTEITSWRTAGASVVATKYLSRNLDKSDKILAIFGAGAQGTIHAIALQRFFKFKEVRIFNKTQARAENLVAKLNAQTGDKGIYTVSQTVRECARNADVIVTATYATESFLKAEYLKDNVHINAIGAGQAHHSELSTDIYVNSAIFVDCYASANVELHGLLDLGFKFTAEIGEVINDTVNAKAAADGKKFTIFHSLGMAVEDCAMAKMIFDLDKKQ